MVLILDNDDAQALLEIGDVVAGLESSYLEHARGTSVCRPRIDVRIPIPGEDTAAYQWGSTEGGSPTTGYFALRIKSDVIYEQEHADGTRTQEKYCGTPGTFCGLVLLFSARNGLPLAIINDGYLQQQRVGADAALGCKYMARDRPWRIGMLGSGGMARSHIAALASVNDIEQLKVFSPTAANRERFAAEVRDAHGINAVALHDPDDVYRDVDVLCSCTDVAGELIEGKRLEPGVHVTASGGRPDRTAMDRFTTWLRLGNVPPPLNAPEWDLHDEFLIYVADPASPSWEHHTRHRQFRRAPEPSPTRRVVSLQDLVEGGERPRLDETEITFSERGNIHGAQFHVVAGHLFERALDTGRGKALPTELFLQDVRN